MYTKKQRIAALVGVIALLLLYVATLVCAICNFDGTGRLFAACLYATVGLPILLWIYIAIYGKVTGRETIADLFRQEPEGEQEGSLPEDDSKDRPDTDMQK